MYAQEDTLNADGLFPKYNRPTYRMSAYDMRNFDKILSGELQPSTPVDSDMIRGAFQRAARIMEPFNVLHGLWSWTIRFLPNTSFQSGLV